MNLRNPFKWEDSLVSLSRLYVIAKQDVNLAPKVKTTLPFSNLNAALI